MDLPQKIPHQLNLILCISKNVGGITFNANMTLFSLQIDDTVPSRPGGLSACGMTAANVQALMEQVPKAKNEPKVDENAFDWRIGHF